MPNRHAAVPPMTAAAPAHTGDYDRINRWFYTPAARAVRFVRSQCVRTQVFDRDRADIAGGFVIAVTHVSHLEPFVVADLLPRPIHWMARREFFRLRAGATLLRWAGAFSVDRRGVPVSSIRTAVRLAKEGKVVGIFPEGGCVRGGRLMFRGGRVKRGVCSVALRAGVPVLPVVVLGTQKLTAIEPWLPALQGRVWVAFGRPIRPPTFDGHTGRRADRTRLATAISDEFQYTYRGLLERAGLADSFTP